MLEFEQQVTSHFDVVECWNQNVMSLGGFVVCSVQVKCHKAKNQLKMQIFWHKNGIYMVLLNPGPPLHPNIANMSSN